MQKPAQYLTLFAALSLVISAVPGNATPLEEPPATAKAAGESSSFDPIDVYRVEKIEGWTVYVHPDLAKENAQLERDVLKLLQTKLYLITRRLPAGAVEQLRTIRIFVEASNRGGGAMCFHPSAQWLLENGYNPEKAGAVEISDPADFLDSNVHRQPWAVLHELAHAYHHHFLEGGFGNEAVANLYKTMKKSGTYENARHVFGHTERHYALTNPMEYFAESVEAYFGTNDFFPFVRGELKAHDPAMFSFLEKTFPN